MSAKAETRIAVDVMGGDEAPGVIIRGAIKATQGEHAVEPSRVLLVGPEDQIQAALEEAGGDPGFCVQHASQVVGMDEKPGVALRAKPDSSIAGCVKAIKTGAAGALVSMGNTGAVVGASTLGLGTLEGVRRPGIAVTLQLMGHPVTLLDMGANVVPKPNHLMHYGVMGTVFSRDILGVKEPRVGLLNIGEEKSKGTELLQQAYTLLEESGLNFIGNVEGGDLFEEAAEVVVTDGFTGNVVLKLLENFAGFMMRLVHHEFGAEVFAAHPQAMGRIKRKIDYSEYGGALLLGVQGVVVIGHGRSDEHALSNAIGVAARALDLDVNGHIVEGLA